MSEAGVPLSSAQERLWFLWRLRPAGDEYAVPKAVRLRGRLDVPALERALRLLTERHTVLRATFPDTGGRPRMRIGPAESVRLTVTPVADPSTLVDTVAALVRAPFDLVAGPVFRAHLLRLAEDDHALVLVLHHIVTDGWSMGLLDEELAALYGAAGTHDPLPRPGIQYHEWAPSEARRAEALAYWRQRLTGAPPRSGLRTRPGESGGGGGATRRVALPHDLVDKVAARHRVTRVATLLSAYAVLVARLSATDDVVIGVPATGRGDPTLERVFGLFVTMLPIRVRLAPGLTFARLLRQVRDALLDGQDHQDLPFETLVEQLRPVRSADMHPVFQIALSYEQPPEEEPSLPGLASSALPLPVRTPAFDLTLRVSWPNAWFDYRTGVYGAATIESAAQRYTDLLTAALTNPDLPVARLPLLSCAEQQTLLRDWSRTAETAATERVGVLFARHVRVRPDAIAVHAPDRSMTYGELDRAAGDLAARLRSIGAGPGTLVATVLPRGADLVIAQLAVLKAGAVCVPLDATQPRARLSAILAEAAPLVTLTDLHDVRATGPSGAHHGDAAYVVYTSGSTGRPKGVVVGHRGLANLVAWHHREFGIGPGERTTMIAAPGFDASVWEIFAALTAGATLEVPPLDTVVSPRELCAWLAERRIASAFLPTPLLEQALPWLAGTGVRSVLTGGDRLHEVTGSLPFRLVNNYGPTECTVVATSGAVDGDGMPPIGRPIEGVEAYVLDTELQPVPVGVVGELFLGGVGLAHGYLGEPSLTADRFVPHPFSRGPGARLYRTGDLVRWRGDGALDFLGRNDQQVQVRGFRVELGEIENVLRGHSSVRDAAVVPEESGLAAYLVVDSEFDLAALQAHAALSLPRHMCPRRYLVLPAFPLSPNGKIDRAALPVGAVEQRRAAPVFPRPGEELVALVWAEVLGHDVFGRDDNFFDVGGHSLLLAAVGDRLTRELGRPVPIAQLYAHSTVSGLARYLGEHRDDRPSGSGRGRRPAWRLSPERTDQLTSADTDTHLAVIGMACRFPGASTPEQFWRNLVDGVDGIRDISPEEVAEWGEDPQRAADPRYVAAHGMVEGLGDFDPDFFGITPRDAILLNPQHRVFLELAWEALERAGYDPRGVPGVTALYAGAGRNGYARLVESQPDRFPGVDALALSLANEPEHLVTRVSYVLGLTGPSVAVQTACSSSLVAVHEAGRALLAGDCDFALAGGITLRVPRTGYRYQEGATMSPDGRCRTFSADARGIVAGDGAGIVVLRRLQDAIDDGDHVHAVVRGTAVNNDGRQRAGYTAPGVRGQVEVIRAAHAVAEVEPGSIGYVEAHGTGTPVGDPIEVTALTEAFGNLPAGSVALGSVKTNIGHTDTASGIAGFIKAVLALEHGMLPGTLHHTAPNPRIDIAATPFSVQTAHREWTQSGSPRRAGVSSFGIGGTNAHVVLEETSAPRYAVPDAPALLVLSARSPAALVATASRLAEHLRAHPDLPIEDVAATLQQGRHPFGYRWHAVCGELEESVRALAMVAAVTPERSGEPRVTFRFPPITADSGWAKALDGFPVFRSALDECRAVGPGGEAFAVRYALARLLRDWGVEPAEVTGDGTGQLVAAHVTGALPLAEAIERAGEPTAGTGSPLVLEFNGRVVPCFDAGDPRWELLDVVGQLWRAGVRVNWSHLHAGATRRRVVLPTYPFERGEYLVRPEPAAVAASTATGPEPVAGPVEPALRTMFQQVLGVADDGAELDFFESGGDSLAAVQLVALVDEFFEVALDLEDVFDEPTVSGLAAVVERRRTEAQGRA